MIVHGFPDEGAVAEAAAQRIARLSRDAVSDHGVFRLALAGGSTPKVAYGRLAERSDVVWERVEVFFGDERCVPPGDEASNFRMADETLLSRVPIPANRVHRILGELGPEEAARRYEIVLGSTPLDVVLLGMGTDGHTASLFPGGVTNDVSRRVAPASGPPPHTERVTLTLRAFEEAGTILFLVTGAAKATRLAEVYAQVQSGTEARSAERGAGGAEYFWKALPAAKVRARGSVEWFVDRAAGAELPRTAFAEWLDGTDTNEKDHGSRRAADE